MFAFVYRRRAQVSNEIARASIATRGLKPGESARDPGSRAGGFASYSEATFEGIKDDFFSGGRVDGAAVPEHYRDPGNPLRLATLTERRVRAARLAYEAATGDPRRPGRWNADGDRVVLSPEGGGEPFQVSFEPGDDRPLDAPHAGPPGP
jgi:hypothetical protein